MSAPEDGLGAHWGETGAAPPGVRPGGTGASSAGCLVDVLRSLGRVGGLLGVTRALAGVGLVRVRLLGLAARRLLVLLLGLVDLLPRLLHDAHRSSSVSLGVVVPARRRVERHRRPMAEAREADDPWFSRSAGAPPCRGSTRSARCVVPPRQVAVATIPMRTRPRIRARRRIRTRR